VSLVVLLPLVGQHVLRDAKDLFLFATVNQYVERDLPDSVNTVYWSLTTEWHFYLLVPVVAYVMLRVGAARALLLALGLSIAWYALGPPLGLPAGFVFGRLDQFVAGAFAAELVGRAQRGESSPLLRALSWRGVLPLAGAAVLALGTYHGSTMARPRDIWFDVLLHPLVGLCVAGALVALCTRDGRTSTRLQSRPLRLAGLVSYSLYLWHAPILEHGLRWTGVRAPFGVVDAVAVAAVLAVCAGVACASYVLVERPFLTRRGTPAPRGAILTSAARSARVEVRPRAAVS
jgi:peptidoglycan/LPS O-acetylase OafA/YrhL